MPPHAKIWSTETQDQRYEFVEIGCESLIKINFLANECAISISYNGINQAVMMASPWDLEDFLTGFSLGNGIIEHIDEILDIRLKSIADAWHAELEISSRSFWNLKQQRRQLAGSSGCGLCGVEALEQALPALNPLPDSTLPPAAHLAELRQRLGDAQVHARNSGALHAAAFVDAQGRLSLCREDIGRHNALDKLIGALQRGRHDPRQGFAVVTSRCGLELLHKAVRAGIGTLVSLSAPTSLTVDWARRHNLNLIHAPHRDAPRVYSPAPRAR
ncbi:formate dehydrogenase accessory sulfurtransferase FdhD [Pseudomonas sp. PDM16]|uniref:formate dehydrogenase accessory sulfurtransferase FdhD n=1 Tax=Pseudomonas sp. PDM16 TaxID=2769292 RepID=UPI00177FDC6E|nr:formate dehydrogenase accessory sulfurtransferase FdhD [Pseudomonas sp. PDM16]